MAKFMNPTKVITGPNTTFSYLNCWDAKSINGSTPKFSVSLIIPKSDIANIFCYQSLNIIISCFQVHIRKKRNWHTFNNFT